MDEILMKTVFQLKRGLAEAWARVNPVLRQGEPGFELDTGKLKIGNGIDNWNELPYLVGDDEGALHFKGSVNTKNELPTENNEIGDIWQVIDESKMYVWNVSNSWEVFHAVDVTDAISAVLGNAVTDTAESNTVHGVKKKAEANATAITGLQNGKVTKVDNTSIIHGTLYGETVGSQGKSSTKTYNIMRENSTIEADAWSTMTTMEDGPVGKNYVPVYVAADGEQLQLLTGTPSRDLAAANKAYVDEQIANNPGAKGDKGDKGDKGEKGDPGEVTLEYANNTFANALKGYKSGEAVAITDASPLEHKLGVKVSGVSDLSTVKVKKLGKNILPYPYFERTLTRNGITFTVKEDNTITMNGTATADSYFILWDKPKLPLGKYTIGGLPSFNAKTYRFFANGFTTIRENAEKGFLVFEAKEDSSQTNVVLFVSTGATVENLVVKPQIELGETATAYEPYIEPIEYPISADGTVEGVTLIYPTTTLVTDTKGAVIGCTYNRDINKAFDELYNAIISTGGNV